MQDTFQEEQIMNPTLKSSEDSVKSRNWDSCMPEQQEMHPSRDSPPTPVEDEKTWSAKGKSKREKEERVLKKPRVSKPLLNCLWAQFKLNKYVRWRDINRLSFEFNLTDPQIKRWFRKHREKYYKQMFHEHHDGQKK